MVTNCACLICGDEFGTSVDDGTNKIDHGTINHQFFHRILHIPLPECEKLFQKHDSSSLFCPPCFDLILKGQSFIREMNEVHGEIDGIKFRLLHQLMNFRLVQKTNAVHPSRYLLLNKIKTGLELDIELLLHIDNHLPGNGVQNSNSSSCSCVICKRNCVKITNEDNDKNNGHKLTQILHNILKLPNSSETESYSFCSICSALLRRGQDCLIQISKLEAKLDGIQFRLLDKLLNDQNVQFLFGQAQLFDKNRYNLLESTKVGLKLQPPSKTKESEDKNNVVVFEMECNDQLENCHDGIGIITRTQSMSSSSASSTILNQDQNEQFRKDEAEIMKENDENENLDILLQHENETVNTATTNKEDEHSLVQDSVVEQDILQDDEEFKIEIGPIDENCLSINEDHQPLPFSSLHSPSSSNSSTANTMPSLRPVRVRNTPVRYQPENFDAKRVTQIYDDADNDEKGEQTDESDDDYNVEVDLVEEKQSQAVPKIKSRTPKIKSQSIVRYKSGISMCFLCDATFSNGTLLKKHYQDSPPSGHGNPSVWPCNTCGRKFADKSLLYAHRDYFHKNLPINRTRAQNTQTSSNTTKKLQPNQKKNKLNGHRQLKDMPKPLFCLFCNIPFYGRGAIQLHYKDDHPNTTTSTRWQCLFCPKSYSSTGSLYAHRQRYHLRELEQLLVPKTSRREIRNKIFTCVICKEKCTDVKKHYKEKHGKNAV